MLGHEKYRYFIRSAALKYGIKPSLLGGQISLESNFDPSLVSLNIKNGKVLSRDRGLAQINDYWHPSITDSQAFNPQFAVNWMALYMRELYDNLPRRYKILPDWYRWNAALRQYNTGSPKRTFVGSRYARVVRQRQVQVITLDKKRKLDTI
jgi:soluble lytic murein transglycosylase-like protein